MFFPKTKLFSWIKSHWVLLLIIAVVLIGVGFAVQSCRVGKWQLEAARLDGQLEEQVKDQNLLYEEASIARAERNVAEAKEKRKRADLEARIQKFQKDTVAGKRALKEEKAKTILLPPSELVMQIARRIGDQLTLTGDRLYLFTRTGTERTLDRFQDGEFYLSEYNKFQGVLADHEAEVKSFNTSILGYKKSVATNLEGWDDCRETLTTAQKDIKTLKKVGKASVWKGRKQGAIAVGIILGGLKLFGVW